MDSRDLLNRWTWGAPQLVFLLGFVLPWRPVVWTASLLFLALLCGFNAVRCGRTHCFFTASFFLLSAAVYLAYLGGALPLGSQGWLWIGFATVVGSNVLAVVPERLWGRHLGERVKT